MKSDNKTKQRVVTLTFLRNVLMLIRAEKEVSRNDIHEHFGSSYKIQAIQNGLLFLQKEGLIKLELDHKQRWVVRDPRLFSTKEDEP